jgi:hypothetical protein
MKKKSHFGLLMIVFKKGVVKQFKDIVSLLLILLKCLFNKIHCLFTLNLCVFYLCADLNNPSYTTFLRSFILRILNGI